MKLTQVYGYLNEALKSTIGETAIINEDLSNIVDMGTAVYDANAVDPLTKTLINRIGKDVYSSKALKFNSLSIFKEGWEYGSIKRMIYADMPENKENQSWGLQNGMSVDPHIYYGYPKIHQIMWNSKNAWEVRQSFTDTELKQSFESAEKMAAFLGMIEMSIKNKLAQDVAKLTLACYNNMIAETLYNEYPSADYGTRSTNKAVNLLYLFNEQFRSGEGDTKLTAAECMFDKDFIRFAAYTMGKYIPRLETASKLFNIKGYTNQTAPDDLHIVMHTEFKQAANVYLQSEVFHNEFTQFPKAEEVPYWQGTGTNYDLASTATIIVKTSENHDVACGGILAVMHDDKALAVCSENRRTTSDYTGAAEFTTYYYKSEAEYINNPFENFVVFFVADED